MLQVDGGLEMRYLAGLRGVRDFIVLGFLFLVGACSPAGAGDAAPPLLELDRNALAFGPAEDVKPLLVKNVGGSSLSFTVQASASSDGVAWLQATPENGAVDAGSTTTVLVHVVGRDKLAAGTYTGEVTVSADGVGSEVVLVSMEVAQPLLDVDPMELDYGASLTSMNLVVRNSGAGQLVFALHLPGTWMTASGALQKSIGPGEPVIFELQVLRAQVPWYGQEAAELLITSNGLDDADHTSTIKVPVLVDVDASCSSDSECVKEGYFCDLSAQSGACTKRLKLGKACEAQKECLSGSCADGVCCDSPCQAPCQTCAGPGGPGVCGPGIDGLACENGDQCTYGGICAAGSCQVTAYSCDDELDCTMDVCLGEKDACTNAPEDGWCAIDDECVAAGQMQPGSGDCASCKPESNPLGWTDEVDGLSCDDSDPCTLDDQCHSGACEGTLNDCDDGLVCTLDLCQPDTGECEYELDADWCKINDSCYQTGMHPEGPDKDCKICQPDSSTKGWTPDGEGQVCNDLSDCTKQSSCQAGVCFSSEVLCDDGNICTDDKCLDNKVCENKPVLGVTYCNDDLACTQFELCVAGVCQGTPTDCGATDCMPAWCDDDTGDCLSEAADNGTVCDDGNPCTENEGCLDGQCEGEPKDCSELTGGSPCKKAFCDPDSEGDPGQCVVELLGVGESCSDGLFCTVDEVCDAAGECVDGKQKSCDGLFGQCSDGICVEFLDECVSDKKDEGTPCNADDDGCTLADSCSDGLCLPGDPAVCIQEVPTCHLPACQSQGPADYLCAQVEAPSGELCDDGKFCTSGEVCDDDGNCGGGKAKDCQSQLAECQVGTCNEIMDSCKIQPASDGTWCDDADDCTLVDECSNGVCSGGANACTERKLNSLAASLPYGGAADIAHLGYGTTVTVWGWNPAVATVVNEELSKVVPGKQLETGPPCNTPPGSWTSVSKCTSYGFPEMHGRAVAARPDGHWLVTEMNRCGVTTTTGPYSYFITDMGDEDGSFAAFDGKLQESAPWSASDAPWLWQTADKCAGGSWLVCIQQWCGIWMNHIGLKPPDEGSVGALAFGDGSFGLLSDSGLASYRAVSSGFVPGQLTELAGMHAPQGCVLPSNNAVIVYDDGAGSAYGMFHDKNGNSLGDPFAVSETLDGNQERPYCESLPDGRFVVLFNTGFDSGPADVYARVFKPNGSPQTDTVKLNTATTGLQQAVEKPAVLSDGTIVVAWEDEKGDAAGYGVKGRVFDADLTPVTDELLLNSREAGAQRWPVVQETGTGWMVVWAEALGGNLYDLYFRKFHSTGAPQKGAPERLAAATTSGDQRDGAVAALPDGDFALVWAGDGIDGPDSGIGLRLFDPTGMPTCGDLQVNEYAAGPQHEPAVAYDKSSDRLLVAWTSTGQEEMDDVYARVLDAAGQPVSAEFLVNGTTADVQYEPAVATCGDGTFAVAWTSYTSIADGNDVFLRRFDDSGSALCQELRINSDAADDQGQPAVLAYSDDAGSGILTGWTRTSIGGDVGVYGKLFDVAGDPVGVDVLISDEDNPEQVAFARNDAGALMACWKTTDAIRCRRLDAELKPVGGVFDAETEGSPGHPRLLFRDTDSFWLTYERTDVDAGGQGLVRADLYLTGAVKGSPILVNWHEEDDQSSPFMARLAADDIVIGWTGANQDGDGDGVFFRVLD